MKAVRFHEYGGIDVLRYEDLDRPRPGPGEVLIEVAGAAFNPIVKRMRWLTNGSDGKSSKARLTPPNWFGSSRDDQRLWVYVVVVAVAVVTFVLVSNMVRGRPGRALAALRHDELSAVAFGIATVRTRRIMFAVSAGITGLAGAMAMLPSPFAQEQNYVDTLSFQLYAAVYLGGIGALSGSIVGGAVIVALPFATKWFGMTLVPTLIYGAVLVLVTVFVPDGVMGTVRRVVGRVVQVVPSRSAPPAVVSEEVLTP